MATSIRRARGESGRVAGSVTSFSVAGIRAKVADVVSTIRYVAAPDGVRLSLTVTGSGRSVVLVHGGMDTSASWSGVVDELEADYTCFAYDRRGNGASEVGTEHSLAVEADDVIAVAAETGPDAVVVGHSYGAIVVLEALRRGLDVAAAVLYEPPLPVSERVIAANREAAAAAMGAARMTPVMEREIRSIDETLELLVEYTRVATPLLLLEGAASPLQFREPVGYLARRVAGVQVKELVGQDHFAHRRAPALLAEVLREFLR